MDKIAHKKTAIILLNLLLAVIKEPSLGTYIFYEAC